MAVNTIRNTQERAGLERTFLLQKDTALGNNNRNISVDVALAVLIDERNGDVGVGYALSQRHPKDAWSFCL